MDGKGCGMTLFKGRRQVVLPFKTWTCHEKTLTSLKELTRQYGKSTLYMVASTKKNNGKRIWLKNLNWNTWGVTCPKHLDQSHSWLLRELSTRPPGDSIRICRRWPPKRHSRSAIFPASKGSKLRSYWNTNEPRKITAYFPLCGLFNMDAYSIMFIIPTSLGSNIPFIP